MEPADQRPTALVALRRDGDEVLLGPVHGPEPCDLPFLDDLLRLHLAARRFGWAIHLSDVRADLLELVELVGLHDDLVGEARGRQPSRNGGRPNSANSSG